MGFDVSIAGAGPVGSVLAIALAQQGKNVLVVDSRDPRKFVSFQGRKLALSFGTKVILETIGIWADLPKMTPIKTVHVSIKGKLGKTLLQNRDLDLPELGYVINYGDFQARLHELLIEKSVQFRENTSVEKFNLKGNKVEIALNENDRHYSVESRLAVVASGNTRLFENMNVSYRKKNYNQTAFLAVVESDQNHNYSAFERFTKWGAIALLPYGKAFALVWIGEPEQTTRRLQAKDDELLRVLQDCFGFKAGNFTSIKKINSIELSLIYASQVAKSRTIVVGNSAQTLHPIAAQGLNLGLRDVLALVELSKVTQNGRLGNDAFLQQYKKARSKDRLFGISFTNALSLFFSRNLEPLAAKGGLGLLALDMFPSARKLLMRKMIFG